MASSPFKIKSDVRRITEDPANRYYFDLGIPAFHWRNVRGDDVASKLDQKVLDHIKAGDFRIAICSSPAEDQAITKLFQYLLVTDQSEYADSCAIQIENLQDWRDHKFQVDALFIYPLSTKAMNWHIQSFRGLWERYNLVFSFCGTKKELIETIRYTPTMIIDLSKENKSF